MLRFIHKYRIALAITVVVLSAAAVWLTLSEPQTYEKDNASVSPLLGDMLLGNEESGFQTVSEVRKFLFPQDHGPHLDFQTEWWYFTGNLKDESGAGYGYQFTVFRRALSREKPRLDSNWSTNQVYLAHAGVTDLQSGEYLVDEMYSRDVLGLAGARAQPFSVYVENWSASGSSGDCRGCLDLDIAVTSDDFTLDLQLVSVKDAVLHGKNGLSRKSESNENASYYYSLTRMHTDGTLTIHGQSLEVTGTSWMDHEWFSSALDETQSGWDWFSLQLDDGREMMFFQVRHHDDSKDSFKYAVLIDGTGTLDQVPAREVSFRPMQMWTSPETQSTYPVYWRIEVPQRHLVLDIEATVNAQERHQSFRYWEGSVQVSASERGKLISGVGYLEMTGY